MPDTYAFPHSVAPGAESSGRRPGPVPGRTRYQRLFPGCLEIASGTRMQVSPAAGNVAFVTEYIGAYDGSRLLLRFPDQDGARQALPPQSAVTVRFAHPRYSLCGFATAVAGIVEGPFPLLALEAPSALGVRDQRRQERAPCFLPARVFARNRERRALIVDISTDGCRLVLDNRGGERDTGYARGAGLACNFRLFDLLDEVFASVLVRDVEVRAGRLSLGVDFVHLGQGDQGKVGEYVAGVRGYLAG